MKQHVFFIEDETELLSAYTELLLSEGYKVDSFSSGAEALKAIDQSGIIPDVLVSDYHLHKMTGIDIFKHLKNKNIQIPMILISGFVDTFIVTQCEIVGASGLIEKPYDIQTLVETIDRAIEKNKILIA